MVGWHHRLNGHEFEQALGDGERQGSLVCPVHGVPKSRTQHFLCLHAQSCPALCDSCGLQPARLLCPWDFQYKKTGLGCHFLLQGIFPTNPRIKIRHCIVQRTLFSVLVFQSLSHVRLFANPRTVACQVSLFFTITQGLLKVMSIELLMSSNHLILCYHVLLLPSIFTSIRVFFKESAIYIRWSQYWSFSFSISPSNEYSGSISFRMDRALSVNIQQNQPSETLGHIS